MAGNTTNPGATVTSRALALLAAFDSQHRRLSLTDLAGRANLPLGTAHRLIAELQDWGALTRRPDGRYAIGRRVWDIGLLAPVQTDVREAASPFLNDLYGATLATVHLAIRDDDQALYVDRVAGHASVPVISTTGSRLPLHTTGVGKVLLAHSPDEVVEKVLTKLVRYTPHTVTHVGRLRAQITRIRREGFATTTEEMTLGACSVAVPVFRGPNVVAAIGIVVPRLKGDRERIVVALQVAAQGISRSLR